MLKIAVYGKGGIGKSTTTSNVAVAFTELGHRVMLIGCDPKADSSKNLCNRQKVPTVLDVIRTKGIEFVTLEDIVIKGDNGIFCVEAGGPTPGLGCAGRGIITAFEKLEALGAYEYYKPDIVLYDVLGDVVCGGFAMPIRDGYAEHVFVVTSGEKMSTYAAANIICAIDNFKKRGYARCAGIILNSRNVDNEYNIVKALADDTCTQIIKVMPRNSDIQKAEERDMTVIKALPDSTMAYEYRALAKNMLEACMHDTLQKR